LQIQYTFFFNVDFIAWRVFASNFNKVADFSFQANVCNQAFTAFRVKTRHISCIRIAIGVAVGDIKEIDKFVAVLDRHD